MSRVVGGVFALETDGPPRGEPAWLSESSLLLANARGGFRLLLRHLQPSQAWLPAFLCDSMWEAIDETGARARLYPVDERLETPDRDWLAELSPGDVVVLVDYFGYVRDDGLAAACRERGAIVVEDACHALLTDGAGSLGDYVLWSPRKFAGLPDGGVLQAVRAPLPEVSVPAADQRWWALALEATRRRAAFDAGGPRDFLPVHQQAELGHPIEPVSMSPLARSLAATIDWGAIAARRRANHDVLAAKLARHALMPPPPPGTVPSGFTVRVNNRDEVRAALFEADIFPSLLWPSAGWIPVEFAASHALSAQVMTLHCDQRYDAADMIRTSEIVLDTVQA